MRNFSMGAWQRDRNQGIWVDWIRQQWPQLATSAKITAPLWLPSAAASGFDLLQIAHPAGQFRDWALSLSDGSRIHVHEYLDGARVVHRDVHDPKRGLGPMLAHLMQETPYGLLAGVAVFLLIAKTASG